MDHSHHDMHDMHNMHNMNMNESDGMSHDHSGHHDHSAHDHGASMDTTTMVSSAMNMVMNHTAHAAASSHGSHGSHSGSMHGMSMSFHGGFAETILFDCWKISTVSGLIGSMIGIIIMAALYEGLKYYREYLFWKTYNSLQYRSVSMPREKNVVAEDNRVVQPTMLSWMHTFQTLLHIIQIVLSYFLMLIFMTFNYWLGLAVVLGGAIGYFLFGWKKSVIVDVTEHCH